MEIVNTIDHSVGIIKIPSDGNCLVASLAHQLDNSLTGSTSTYALRQRLNNHLRTHIETYSPYLQDATLDQPHRYAHIKDWERKTEAYLKDHAQNGFWLGLETIIAASDIFNVSSEIHHEQGRTDKISSRVLL
ncbi:unnamed protein product [Brassicogethes aeneus]|uniref:OTU domain-containing protein n=1 Tax=Brassicogethes aeneus TaxID=1431903 RepID=A0A9P0B2E5_BRAAE|nr:unnamed protein product [Brassicogethes aeneus]